MIPLLRNSERQSFNDCPAKWNWGWNKGLTLCMPVQNAAWFGGIVHVALAEWYTPPGGTNGFARGRNPVEAFEELAKEQFTVISAGPDFSEVAEKEYHDAFELGKMMILGYLGEYGTDDSWEVLMPEMRFRAGIPFNARQNLSRIAYGEYWQELGLNTGNIITTIVGTSDIIVRDHKDGHIKVVDHKTTDKKENIAWLTKDNQLGLYIAIFTSILRKAGMIGPKEAVTTAVWNYLRKGKPDPRPTDDQGRCCNQPKKANYASTLSKKLAGISEQELMVLSLPKLEDLANKYKIEVLGDVSLTQPSPLFWRDEFRRNKHNRLRQLERVADDAEAIAAVRSGISPVRKSPGEHCAWCQFKELCDVDEDGGDVDQFIKDVFKVQDMYADHRKGALNSKESVIAKKETGAN